MKKKIGALIIFALLVVCVLPVTALAAVGDSDSDGTYSFKILTDTTCEITGYSGSETGTLTIPGSLTGATYGTFSVTGISTGAFQNKSMAGAVVPEGVTYLGSSAFYGCSSLASITLPSTLTSIGSTCFTSCTKLTGISLPNGLTTIGEGAFSGDSLLAYVIMDNNVTSIGTTAFLNCGKLTDITLSDKLQVIEQATFQGSGLTYINIPGSVQNIRVQAFSGCPLTSITLHKGLVTIDQAAFISTSISEITIPSTVTAIGQAAFASCSKLTKATILGSTATFGYGAFGGDNCTIYGFANSTAYTYATTKAENFENKTFPFRTIYTVTFNSNKGNDISSQIIPEGEKIAKDDDPTRDKYVFAGWYKDAALTSAWNFDTDTVSKDMTLYARWYYKDSYDRYYDGNEYDQLKKFLDSPSVSAGVTNGKLLNDSYNSDEPTTFSNLNWNDETEGSYVVHYVTWLPWNDPNTSPNLDGDLDLSNFRYLTVVRLTDTQIDSLKVDNDTSLTNLECTNTHVLDKNKATVNTGITALNVSTCPALVELQVYNNALTSLDLSANTALVTLNCSENAIDSLDIKNNTKLTTITCNYNKITSLDTSAAADLDALYCDNNAIASLKITGNTKLEHLECNDNRLSGSLDLSGLSALTKLYCFDNGLTSLNLTDCALLDTLKCNGNNLTGLSIGSNTNLKKLYCNNNQIGSLIISANTKLTDLNCYSDGLSSLDVSKNIDLKQLNCRENRLGSLDVSNNTGLNNLDCSDCGLSALDLSKNKGLKGLTCNDNSLSETSLTGLSPSTQTSLRMLSCKNNQFMTLDMSDFGSFTSMDCTGNPLKAVKVNIVGNGTADTYVIELKAKGEGYTGTFLNIDPNDVSKCVMYAEASPKTGGAFKNWTDAKDSEVSKTAKYDLAVNTSYDLTANFVKTYAITAVSGNAAFGSVSGGGSYVEGNTVTLKAMPSAGCRFTGWYKGTTLVSPNAEYTFTASENITLTAQFGLAPSCTITVTSGNPTYGSVSGGGSFVPGTSVTLTATANAGYYFAGWYNGSTMVSASASYTFSAASDISLTAKFDKIGIPVTITASSSAYNKITVRWSAVAGAKGYYIYRSTSADGKYKKIGTSKKTSYANSGVTTGVTYYYKVAAYTKSYTGKCYSAVASAASALGKVTKVTVKSSNPTKAVIKWKTVTGAKKYQVLRSDTKGGVYKAVKTTSSKTITDKGLIPGSTYYYKVIAYRGSAYSVDSDIVSVTAKTVR